MLDKCGIPLRVVIFTFFFFSFPAASHGYPLLHRTVSPPSCSTSSPSFLLNHTAQAGVLSQKKSLSIDKGGESAPALDHQSLSVSHAVSAPKPPSHVNAVDKASVRVARREEGAQKEVCARGDALFLHPPTYLTSPPSSPSLFFFSHWLTYFLSPSSLSSSYSRCATTRLACKAG